MIGVEVCARCGFERADWSEQDAQRTLQHAKELLDGWAVEATGELDHKLHDREIDDLRAIETSDDVIDKVHHLMHGLVSLADVRRAAGDAVRRQIGSISKISASRGGVPKLPVESAVVGRRGVVGDVQSARIHHGRPWQALCLWSAEVIDALVADGHPIMPGAAGENLTISGIDWSTLRGGTILDIGGDDSAVRCQLSAPAVPCAKNARWFADGEISLMDHGVHPGMCRWYASVVRSGTIRIGDPVIVSPG